MESKSGMVSFLKKGNEMALFLALDKKKILN
jgi:hypothetical protein